jgi:hypothetical protein
MEEKMQPANMHSLFALSCVVYAIDEFSFDRRAAPFCAFALRHDNVNLFADWKLKSRA